MNTSASLEGRSCRTRQLENFILFSHVWSLYGATPESPCGTAPINKALAKFNFPNVHCTLAS